MRNGSNDSTRRARTLLGSVSFYSPKFFSSPSRFPRRRIPDDADVRSIDSIDSIESHVPGFQHVGTIDFYVI